LYKDVKCLNSAPYPETLVITNKAIRVRRKSAFSSREYLGKDHPSIFIASSATADIDFFIGVPEQDIGGYSIELK
jgi:hypothetical protein